MQIALEFSAANSEQRTHNLSADFAAHVLDFHSRMNSSQTAQTSSANQAHQNGFRLIVECVCSRDFVDDRFTARSNQLAEELVAQLARCGFCADAFLRRERGDIAAALVEREIVMSREIGDERLDRRPIPIRATGD